MHRWIQICMLLCIWGGSGCSTTHCLQLDDPDFPAAHIHFCSEYELQDTLIHIQRGGEPVGNKPAYRLTATSPADSAITIDISHQDLSLSQCTELMSGSFRAAPQYDLAGCPECAVMTYEEMNSVVVVREIRNADERSVILFYIAEGEPEMVRSLVRSCLMAEIAPQITR